MARCLSLLSQDQDTLEDITVIVPVLNEEKSIGLVIDELLSIGIRKENILVVDGGSFDKTFEIAMSRGVRVVHQEGQGKAMAIATGLKYVGTPYVVVMDGDYTYPASYIPRLLSLAKSRNCDLVIGARTLSKRSQSLIFKLGNKMLTLMFNLLYGVRVKDVLSGMYLARRDKLLEVGFEMKGFSIEVEIVSHFANLATVCEEPIEYRPRIDPSAKKLRITHGFHIAKDILRLTWRYNPAFLIFGVGSLLTIPGLALGSWVLYRYLKYGFVHHIRGLAAIIITGIGLLSLISAIQSIYIRRMEQRLHRKLDQAIKLIHEKSK